MYLQHEKMHKKTTNARETVFSEMYDFVEFTKSYVFVFENNNNNHNK